jgi:hypothetical protein
VITLACLTCHLALRTTGEPVEVDFLVGMRSDWYPDRYPCPRSGCKGTMTLTDVIESKVLPLLEIHDVNPQECFQALKGMGLPEEKKATLDLVVKHLEGKTIQSIEVEPVSNALRTVVRSILMADGTRLYFGSSPQGATVYRIAPPRSLTTEAFNGG